MVAGLPPHPTAAGPLASRARASLLLSVILVVGYVALDVVAQLLPPHYDPISQAESDLAVGPYGYVMTVNFVVRGILALTFLLGLSESTDVLRRSSTGTAFVLVWGIGAFLLAVFPTDVGGSATVHGVVHLWVAALAFAGGAAGEFLLSRHFREETRLRSMALEATTVSSLALLFLFVVFASLAVPYLDHHIFGLVERVFIGLVLLWMLLVSVHLLTGGGEAVPTDSVRVAVEARSGSA
jgi:Protein of unknown function (DUF998)